MRYMLQPRVQSVTLKMFPVTNAVLLEVHRCLTSAVTVLEMIQKSVRVTDENSLCRLMLAGTRCSLWMERLRLCLQLILHLPAGLLAPTVAYRSGDR